MTTLLDDRGAVTFTADGGGWLTLRRAEPALRGLTPPELLNRARTLPGARRYVIEAGAIFLIGEVRNTDGLPFEAIERHLPVLLDEPLAVEPPPAEAIEAALDATGCAWARRAATWSVAVRDRQAREVLVSVTPGAARASAVLADWDEIAPVCRDALAECLLSAQAGLRCARCELDENRACVAGSAGTANLDADLVHVLLGVATGIDLLAREAAALLRPELAEIYLTGRRMPSKGP